MWAGDFSALLWLPSLSAGGEIPLAFLVFVSLVMYVQKGASGAEATVYTSLLMLPWLWADSLRRLPERAVPPKYGIVAAQLCAAAVFGFLSWYIRALDLPLLTLCLLVLSLSALAHRIFCERYRHRCLDASHRRLMGHPLSVWQHMVVLLAYGAFIMLIGLLQIYFRQFSLAWMMGCRLLAATMLVLAVYHLLVLPPLRDKSDGRAPQPAAVFSWKSTVPLFLLLLPQSLMFHTRTLFLLDDSARGGLGSTLQDIGFAQGTVGLLAFILGFSVYHRLARRLPARRLFPAMSALLGLSPLVYLAFTAFPPAGLWTLSAGTFAAQLCFGMGLGAVRRLQPALPSRGYHMLYTPAVLAAMILPMALSGWMAQQWGYSAFFLLNALSGLLFWGLFLGRRGKPL